jgi:hypothetical protein
MHTNCDIYVSIAKMKNKQNTTMAEQFQNYFEKL